MTKVLSCPDLGPNCLQKISADDRSILLSSADFFKINIFKKVNVSNSLQRLSADNKYFVLFDLFV